LGNVIIRDPNSLIVIPAEKIIDDSKAHEEKKDAFRRLKNGKSSLKIYKLP